MLTSDLKQSIDALWQSFWSNGMQDHMAALKHISYLLFIKKLEDTENNKIIAAKDAKKKYESIFDNNDSMRWSVWKNYEGRKMLSHVRDKVFPFIKNIKSNGKMHLDLGESNFEITSPILLQNAVQVIDELSISEQNQDTQGDIYEHITSYLKTAGLNGQFRTPRHIIRMMVQLLDPDVHQKICDPACGTGGFIINAYQHILKKYTSKNLLKVDSDGIASNLIGDKLSEKQREFLLNEQFSGYDYDNPMIQICQMNMILHGFSHSNVKFQNSTGKEYNQGEEYHVILANPPFAGNLNKSEINEDFSVKTTKTELLFAELFYNKLLVGGQAAVIVPAGVLFGSSKAHIGIKKLLLEKCQLDAIIYLPSGVFKPYSGSVTAILFFTKGGTTNKIWIYEMEADGLSLDDKRNPVKENDIPDVLEQFPKRGKSKFAHNDEFKSLTITIDDIKENGYNLNVRRYIDNPKPEVIIDVQKTSNELNKLKKESKKLEDQLTKDLKELGFKV